jgi:dUTP pyrophosphatase
MCRQLGHRGDPNADTILVKRPRYNDMRIPLQRLDEGLPIPAHAHPGDGGVDLYSRESVRLEAGQRAVVPTGIAVAIPDGYAGLVTPRSGLAARNGISVVNGPGLVDSGYRGEIKVVLVNLSGGAFEINRGDRIAQFVVIPVSVQDYVPVEELPDSTRGSGGFGSTGA